MCIRDRLSVVSAGTGAGAALSPPEQPTDSAVRSASVRNLDERLITGGFLGFASTHRLTPRRLRPHLESCLCQQIDSPLPSPTDTASSVSSAPVGWQPCIWHLSLIHISEP